MIDTTGAIILFGVAFCIVVAVCWRVAGREETRTGTLVCRCPAMKVHRIDADTLETTALPCDVEARGSDGTGYSGQVVFPVTKINRVPGTVARYLVQPVTAMGTVIDDFGQRYPVEISLAAEGVIGPVALSVRATGCLGSSKLSGSFPWVFSIPEGGGNFLVMAVTARLTITV